MAGTASADPYYTSKDTYTTTVTTNFKWHWPETSVRTTNYVETKPYHAAARYILLAGEDVSKYRFYYRQNTCKNDWGYFFKPGEKLCYRHPTPFSGIPVSYSQNLVLK